MSVMIPRVPLFAKNGPESARHHTGHVVPPGPAPRRRGRPPMRTPEQVLEEIRSEAAASRLFRVHLDRPALYARARRIWGSWALALRAAGLDPRAIHESSRARARETRRARRDGPTA